MLVITAAAVRSSLKKSNKKTSSVGQSNIVRVNSVFVYKKRDGKAK